MKRLAALLLIALAFCACEETEKLSIEDDNNTETPTASFYVQMITHRVPTSWEEIIGSKSDEKAKTGAIYLVDKSIGDQIYQEGFIQNGLNTRYSSWKDDYGYIAPPFDSNYNYNHDDLFSLFNNNIFSSKNNIKSPYGMIDIPYGEYILIGIFGLYHSDTLRAYKGSFNNIIVNKLTNFDTINLPIVVDDFGFW